MRLSFDTSLSEKYNSSAQKIRVMSESWLGDNMYCPNCGNPRISHLTNNSPVADFQCDNCGEIAYTGDVAENLERIVKATKQTLTEVAVVKYPGAVA